MKYSVLSIAAIVAPALGNPAYFWRQYIPHRIHPANAGTISINNYVPANVHVDVEPQGYQYTVAPGGQQSVPGAPVADVKFNGEVEVSYVSGDQGTFNYVINPIGGNFPGCVNVSPDGCGSLTWCSGQPPTSPVTCPADTELRITLYSPNYMWSEREFLL
ncbi:hypothetical protein BDV27DRAFT_139814 [Aspergillus caelatus]|uniref:Uncharacterized protein n=1 Tax=Aspergillus caelatus TaxID=61420 RepID=A0A5N6ZHQ0_9EURO|nr:uncharacterized protein BDV27DRAFT_139814 [Aspergillus caelatus]KAE8357187.1 hypothetical protein BDV27DRAFT_139814 [Aspergillus caelatus]